MEIKEIISGSLESSRKNFRRKFISNKDIINKLSKIFKKRIKFIKK